MSTFVLVDHKSKPLIEWDGAVPIVINFLEREKIQVSTYIDPTKRQKDFKVRFPHLEQICPLVFPLLPPFQNISEFQNLSKYVRI